MLVLGLVAPLLVVAESSVLPPVAAEAAPPKCESPTDAERRYDVAAFNVDIPFNRWGDVDPNGAVFALEQDRAAIRNWSKPLADDPANDPAGNRRLRPRPLVLRANAGECVEVTLTNLLNQRQFDGGGLGNPRVSLHVHGPAYNVRTSDGSAVGFNADTTIGHNERATYYWLAPEEGLYFFHDHGALAGSQADGGSNVHGLYGALAVQPAGSEWRDPVSGRVLSTPQPYSNVRDLSGDYYVNADIYPPNGPSFREFVQISQDEIPSVGMGFNYGSEPAENRLKFRCPDCVGEETALSSWPYGDPSLIKLASGPGPWLPSWVGPDPPSDPDPENCGLGTAGFNAPSCWVANVQHAYRGDPTKIRFGHAGPKETHVFHLHAHQWLAEPKETGAAGPMPSHPTQQAQPTSTTIDSQTMGPGDMFTAELLFGAGGRPGTIGDALFHCHLYPHFFDGFWAVLRVHDVREDGSGATPDGIRVANIEPLAEFPGRVFPAVPPEPDMDNPGFPRFIPGEIGWRPPQPPGAVTHNGQDAPRIVAGRELTEADTAVEASVQQRFYGTQPPPRGAPLTDPCRPKPGQAKPREVTYNVSVLQLPIVYNEAGWYDTQARILALDEDVDDLLAGRKKAEPLFIRVNAGDCINFNLTNLLPNWFGNDAFLKLTQTNMVGEHIHLVDFDVLGSDGSTNGWNYNQAAFTERQAAFNRDVLAGTQACSAEHSCRLPLPPETGPGSYDPTWTGRRDGQTIHERWYAGYELRTVFTHDHHFPAIDQNRGLFGALIVEPPGADTRDPVTGQFFQPINDAAHGPPCGTACVGNAAGAIRDIIMPNGSHFREFGLAMHDFVSLTRAGGDPRLREDTFNPPRAPEDFPDEDPGIMGVNYRNAPFVLREQRGGVPVDPAYRFSSRVFGDPMTPLLRAYAGDAVRVRLIGGSHEEQHVFHLHGMRWQQEPNNPRSPLVNSQAFGISDAFNFHVPEMECGPNEDCLGDYLYSSAPTDDLYLGVWGLLRVFGRGTKDLLALPNNVPQASQGQTNFPVSGSPQPPPPQPGNPCPSAAPVRQLHVVALEARIAYNGHGEHDPYGLLYAVVRPGETPESAVERAREAPEPLVLRANEGDCLEVRLTNMLDPAGPFATEHAPLGRRDGDPFLPLEPLAGTPAGLRVSLHPQLLLYDVRYSDGAAIGHNRDSTVGPGQSILYRWYADRELGATNLLDYGDVRGHRHHGLFAGLNIQPRRATYHDPISGAPAFDGAQADIRVPGAADFREFTVFFQDGVNLRDASGRTIPDADDDGDGDRFDPEDQGQKGFNYRTEPFRNRLSGREPVHHNRDNPLHGDDLANVFSSHAHGDPATPIFRAYAGDPVRVRVLQGQDKPRQHSFGQHGHAWRSQPGNDLSRLEGNSGGISVSRNLNVLLPSAGGPFGEPGDYRYNCSVLFHHTSGGLWGITRVYRRPDGQNPVFTPEPLRNPDNPTAPDYHPLLPLERSEVRAFVFQDLNQDGRRGNDEPPLPDAPIELRTTDGQLLREGATGPDGWATFAVPQGAYDVTARVIHPDGWALTTPATVRVDVTADNDSQIVAFGQIQKVEVAIRAFYDRNGLGFEDGDAGLEGWSVTLTGGGRTYSGVTGSDGLATIAGVLPGTYAANAVVQAGWTPTQPLPYEVSVVGDMPEVRLGFTRTAGLSVQLYNDRNQSGGREASEEPLVGWSVTVRGGPEQDGSPVEGAQRDLTLRTDAAGVARFTAESLAAVGEEPLTAGRYRIIQVLQPDWQRTGATSTTAAGLSQSPTEDFSCDADGCTTVLLAETTQIVSFGNYNPNAAIAVTAFNDVNVDGVRQDREGKLTGWLVDLYQIGPDNQRTTTDPLQRTVTGANGIAIFYPLAPRGDGSYASYEVVMEPPPEAEVPWTHTTPATVRVNGADLGPGATRSVAFGFAQLGAIGVVVFHDFNRNAMVEGDEPHLANRNVRLYDRNGRNLLATAVTDGDGRATFNRVSAGTEYQVEVLLPTGWEATAPLGSNGRPTTKVKVRAPSSTTGLEVAFGQFNPNSVDRPPPPTADPPAGSYDAPVSVTLASRSGTTIRYTLDGSSPSGSKGVLYTGPIDIAMDRTLRAVAVDANGNVSDELVAVYDITSGGGVGGQELVTAAAAPPGSWTVLRGTVEGGVDRLAAADGTVMLLHSAKRGNRQEVDGYGSYTVPPDQRSLVVLTIVYEGGASTSAGFDRTVWLYNFATGAWETMEVRPQTAGNVRTIVDITSNPARFLSASGEIRMRVSASHSSAFHLKADEMTFTVTYNAGG